MLLAFGKDRFPNERRREQGGQGDLVDAMFDDMRIVDFDLHTED